MKNKLVLLSLLLAGTTTVVSAQTKEKSYSESWKDNIFISVGAGVQGTTNPDSKFGKNLTPLINVSVGSFGLIKPVSNLQRVYDKKLRILSIYAELISLIENREMNAPLLRHLKAEFGMNGKSTTHILKELSRELDKLDLRNNQLLYVLLEGSMFWQLRQVMRIEQWRHKYGKYLLHWCWCYRGNESF